MSPSPLNIWLDTLHAVAPMQGTLLVGAGAGTSPVVQWLLHTRPEHACLVEADEARFLHLKRLAAIHPTWDLRHEMVAPSGEPIVFNRMNNPAESGLLALSQLKTLWPSLLPDDTGSKKARTGVTLGTLLTGPASRANWLIIDCLPAASLLDGIGPSLASLDVVLARVVINDNFPTAEALNKTLNLRLNNKGFRCIHLESEPHPAIALALYVRDMRATLAQKQDRIEQLLADIADLTSREKLLADEIEKSKNQISLIQELISPDFPS